MERTTTPAGRELRDYVAALRRRRLTVFVVFVLLFAGSVILASVLPPVYKSQSTILIERQEVPPDIVETTVTGYLQERIEAITQRLLTSEKLWAIAEKIDLYGDERAEMGRAAVVSRMQEGIELTMVDVQATNPGTSNKAVVTVAFTLSFEGDTPQTAKAGAEELTELYLAEERRSRQEQAAEVSRFLAVQAESLREQIAGLEKKLAAFKQEHVEKLPELANLNLRLLEQTDDKIERTEEQIQAMEERQIYLRSQMAMTSPHAPIYGEQGQRILSPAERLAVLRAQYMTASATYSPDHPDLARLRREIELLEQQTGSSGEASRLIQELEAMRDRLIALRQRYSEAHPDIKRLRNSIATVEQKLRRATASPTGSQVTNPSAPDNPSYVRLQTEMDALTTNLQTERAALEQLRKKREELEKRLFQTPVVERDYLALSRDYQNAVSKYQEIREKQLEAEAAERLEREHKAQRLSLIRPPYLPGSPDRPHRAAISILGMVLGLLGGIGAASVKEYVDRSVRGSRGVRLVFGAPPLAIVPYIETRADVVRRWLGALGLTVGVAATAAVTLAVVHTHWVPLDEVWEEWTAEQPSQTAVTSRGEVERKPSSP